MLSDENVQRLRAMFLSMDESFRLLGEGLQEITETLENISKELHRLETETWFN